MAIDCSLKCSKGVLISFNLFFWMSGCVFLVLGIWVILDPTKTHIFHLTATDGVPLDFVLYLAYFLIVIGCVIIFGGFCGCCGSLYERRSLLIAYFVFLFLLLCAELAVAIVTLVYREEFLKGLEGRLMNRFKEHYGQDSNIFTQAIDQAQFRFNCCGILSDNDYATTKWKNESVGISNRSRVNVPVTCCILANPDVSNAGSPIIVVSRFFSGTVEESWQHPQAKDETACQDTEYERHRLARHKKGCLEDLKTWFKEDTMILIGLGIGIAFLHILE